MIWSEGIECIIVKIIIKNAFTRLQVEVVFVREEFDLEVPVEEIEKHPFDPDMVVRILLKAIVFMQNMKSIV